MGNVLHVTFNTRVIRRYGFVRYVMMFARSAAKAKPDFAFSVTTSEGEPAIEFRDRGGFVTGTDFGSFEVIHDEFCSAAFARH